jgi:hypothetical protein
MCIRTESLNVCVQFYLRQVHVYSMSLAYHDVEPMVDS